MHLKNISSCFTLKVDLIFLVSIREVIGQQQDNPQKTILKLFTISEAVNNIRRSQFCSSLSFLMDPQQASTLGGSRQQSICVQCIAQARLLYPPVCLDVKCLCNLRINEGVLTLNV